MSKSQYHQADERRFLDERGSSGPLAPNGLNPATIMEKAVRERIVESFFWKEQCFGVNEADFVDRAVDHVRFVGGVIGTSQQKPSPFLCLAFKLLQLAPGDDVLHEYLAHGGERFKYLRALAAFYVRLTRPDDVVFARLEPLLADARKLRRRTREGREVLTFVDEFVDELLTRDRVCGTTLWKMRSRELLDDVLEPRVSPLGDIEDLLGEDDEGDEQAGGDRDRAEGDAERNDSRDQNRSDEGVREDEEDEDEEMPDRREENDHDGSGGGERNGSSS